MATILMSDMEVSWSDASGTARRAAEKSWVGHPTGSSFGLLDAAKATAYIIRVILFSLH